MISKNSTQRPASWLRRARCVFSGEVPQACELGQVLLNTPGLRAAQRHHHLPSVHAVLGPGMGVVEAETKIKNKIKTTLFSALRQLLA